MARARTPYGLEIETPNSVTFQRSTVDIHMDMRDVPPFGGTGDALFASREKGETIFNRMVDFVAAFIERFERMDPRARMDVGDREP